LDDGENGSKCRGSEAQDVEQDFAKGLVSNDDINTDSAVKDPFLGGRSTELHLNQRDQRLHTIIRADILSSGLAVKGLACPREDSTPLMA
jgi:hypothetical protein